MRRDQTIEGASSMVRGNPQKEWRFQLDSVTYFLVLETYKRLQRHLVSN